MPHFTVSELGPADLSAAWPLVRSAAAAPDLQQWQESAESLLSRGGGVIGVAVEEGGYLGVATYEPVSTLYSGNVLRVEILVTFELTRRAPVRAVLCEALDRLARLLGCDAVAVSVPSRSFLAQAKKRVHSIAVAERRFDRISLPDRLRGALRSAGY